MKRLSILALALLASACSTISPEARVREKLVDAGVRPELADCMAGKLVRKLSTDELHQLGRVAKLPGRDPGRMSFDELGNRLQALNDPHIVSVVTRVGLGCAIAG
ncbi:hypothetical protein DMC47_37590 [Nostoc sp. 3335mG]|nr:hypothetical protein DMC47_37590 [Nostoc sp. 3335mG]